MADDDKVKSEDLIQISKDRFLPREVRDTDPKHPEYNIEKEFAKSAKGFDWKFYSILVIFLLIVIGGTFILTTFVERKHQETQYTFNVEDLNLQEQISSTKREEKKVNLAKSQLSSVIKERDEKLKKIEAQFSQKIEEVGKKGLDAAASEAEINNLKTQKESDINKIAEEYSLKIETEEQNVAKAEKEYSMKKSKLESDINKAETIVNNYKRLQQMQIQQLNQKHATELENQKLKYNPNFAETELRTILKSVDKKQILSKPSLEDINGLSRNRVISEAELNTIRAKIQEYITITERMRKIPFTNSVDPALILMQNDTYYLISEYERIMSKMIKNLEILQKYQRAFNQIAEFSVDSGIIIDASTPEDVIYSLKPVIRVENGDIGLIFRQADEYIGSVVFEQKMGKTSARITYLTPNAKIQPLDKIFIKKIKAEEELKVPEEGKSLQEDSVIPTDKNSKNEVAP